MSLRYGTKKSTYREENCRLQALREAELAEDLKRTKDEIEDLRKKLMEKRKQKDCFTRNF